MENKPNIAKIIIAVLLIAAVIIIGIIILTKNNNGDEPEGKDSIVNTESEYQNLKAKDVELEYKENTKTTVIEFTIENLTNEVIEKETVNVMLYDKNNVAISSFQNYIKFIDANGNYKVYAEMLGDFSRAAKIEIKKPIIVE